MAWLVPTVRKLVLTALGLVAIYIGAAQLQMSGDANLLAAAFVAGMIFPDIDILTGIARTTVKDVLLAIIMVLAVVFFPNLTALVAPFCPTTAIHSFLGSVDPSMVCELGLALLAMAVAWVVSEIAVMFIPAKESFHHWTTAIFISGSVALVAYSLRLTNNTELVAAGFVGGYVLHLIGDWGKEKADDEKLKRQLGMNADNNAGGRAARRNRTDP